jgi:hypothetical protein
MKYPASPREHIEGIVYFPRMVGKIRLMAAGELHPDLHANLGKGFDATACSFLGVDYDDLRSRVLEGGDDAEILEWCFENGERPTPDQVAVWSEYMRKKGWRDDFSDILARRIAEGGFGGRDDIHTIFDYIDADEGRI